MALLFHEQSQFMVQHNVHMEMCTLTNYKGLKTIMCNRKSMVSTDSIVFGHQMNCIKGSVVSAKITVLYMSFTYTIFNSMYTEVQGAILPPTY